VSQGSDSTKAVEATQTGELLPSATEHDKRRGDADLADFAQRLGHRKKTFWFLAVAAGLFLLAILVIPFIALYESTPKEILSSITSQGVTLLGIGLAIFGAISLSLTLAIVRLVENPSHPRKELDLASVTSPLYEFVKAVLTAVRDVLKKN